jgi:hypothetical protein
MINREQLVITLLGETIEALSVLDHQRLLSLEKKTMLLAKAGMIHRTSSLLDRQTLLKRMLNETEDNLVILTRLHSGNGNHTWAR